ncbi:nucleoside-diphosphate sugar epimerase/dehydratase [Imperialibacter roseus]|uniref:Nucleoside-diphosphate sugar epimerase/dehydratase n=1 Tax=Imperialibacter roseus TaxID=1324217 RepID=A0ABZ0IP28_9BACT|nr:nucleoside-diphosphate sugar epimerase/dehydratase [Imperialibacter roseus]WOK06267.1 nucleoside-diphosphate sugar epimerase/dehydratase [Imperialibacter roseus]
MEERIEKSGLNDNRSFIILNKSRIKFLIDALIWGSLTFFGFLLRVEFRLLDYIEGIVVATCCLIVVKCFTIWHFKLHRQSWQNVGLSDFYSLIKADVTVVVFSVVLTFILRPKVVIPYSVPFIEGALMLLVLGGVRVLFRYYFKNFFYIRNLPRRKRVLIAGAGEVGTMVAREMLRNPKEGFLPVAFLDDDSTKHRQRFLGVPVLGKMEDMADIIDEEGIDELIIAMPNAAGDTIRKIVEYAQLANIPHRTIPRLNDLISGKVNINFLRNVELEDLLRREPVQLDTTQISAYLKRKRVMVTGAGGSIGSEIVRQLTRFDPETIIMVGRGESSLHLISIELRDKTGFQKFDIRIADVRDRDTLEKLFEQYKPEVIFHAAAHKHVPFMEDNPAQSVFNNVIGTKNLTELALKYNVKHFVNISTDKAVNPTSVMGASKRVSEHLVSLASSKAEKEQYFVSVRFGNVLGSRGSVIPIFKEQIKNGGPITITHPEMVRYFMTIPEASQLVLQAGAMNKNGSLFILDMGKPVKILDMARDLISLSGLIPDQDIKIVFSGVRPGEKMFEELLTSQETLEATVHGKIFSAKKNVHPNGIESMVSMLEKVAQTGDIVKIKKAYKEIIPSYTP